MRGKKENQSKAMAFGGIGTWDVKPDRMARI